MAGVRPARSVPAQTVKVHRAMGEHDMSMPVVAGDEQQVRTAHAEPFGALVRRHSMAADLWTVCSRAARVGARRPDLTSPSAVVPDSGNGTRPNLFVGIQHRQSSISHAEHER